MANNANINAGPRIINGVLKWHEGDTFALIYTVDLFENEETEPYKYVDGDKLVFSFNENKSNRIIYSFVFPNISSSHEVTLNFNKDISKMFKAGLYSYSIKLMTDGTKYSDGPEIITIGAQYKVEVERCHQ